VGLSLFSDYLFPFEVVSILLMIGIVGSILLAKRRIS
jgi:NADH-quinone oxidoreductase subunit J